MRIYNSKTKTAHKINAYDMLIEFMNYNKQDNLRDSVTVQDYIDFLEYANNYVDMEIPEYKDELDLLCKFFIDMYNSGEWMVNGEFVPHLNSNYDEENDSWEIQTNEYFNNYDTFLSKSGNMSLNENANFRLVLLNYYDNPNLNPSYKFTKELKMKF